MLSSIKRTPKFIKSVQWMPWEIILKNGLLKGFAVLAVIFILTFNQKTDNNFKVQFHWSTKIQCRFLLYCLEGLFICACFWTINHEYLDGERFCVKQVETEKTIPHQCFSKKQMAFVLPKRFIQRNLLFLVIRIYCECDLPLMSVKLLQPCLLYTSRCV